MIETRRRSRAAVNCRDRDRLGEESMVTYYPRGTPMERCMAKVEKQGSGCWVWTASTNYSGYGRFRADPSVPRMVLVHRWLYEQTNGPIPDGIELDHICRVRRCVNPDHLRLVTRELNAQNIGVRKDNTSGYRGVGWNKQRNKWQASVKFQGRAYHAGFFSTAAEAGEAARLKRLELFTHNAEDRATP